jgi:hypothetical protein
MADTAETQQTDENSQNSAAATSTVAEHSEQTNPPAAEKAVVNSGSENRVPQSRFNEVVEQRNHEREVREQYESRIRELESRASGTMQSESVEEKQVKRLVESLKLAPEAAREIVASQSAIAGAERGRVEAQMRSYQLSNWQRQMEEKHKDFRDLMPQMEKVYMSLPQIGQQYAVSSLEGLQMVYDKAKSSVADNQIEESYRKGAESAYSTKSQKQAVSSGPGQAAAAGNGKITLSSINGMSLKDYEKNLPEINRLISEGKLE